MTSGVIKMIHKLKVYFQNFDSESVLHDPRQKQKKKALGSPAPVIHQEANMYTPKAGKFDSSEVKWYIQALLEAL